MAANNEPVAYEERQKDIDNLIAIGWFLRDQPLGRSIRHLMPLLVEMAKLPLVGENTGRFAWLFPDPPPTAKLTAFPWREALKMHGVQQ